MPNYTQQAIWLEILRNESISPRWSRELILCWQMTGEAILYDSKNARKLTSDMLTLIPLYHIFHLDMSQGQTVLFHIDLHQLDSSITDELPSNFSNLLDEPTEKLISIKILLARLARTLSIRQRFNRVLIHSELCSLIYELCTHFGSYSSAEQLLDHSGSGQMESILHFIDEQYTTRLTLEALGKQFFMSPSYFSRLFKNKIGMTPGEYINLLRITQAERMLRNSDLCLEDIAEHCGFADVHAFIRSFKQLHQTTPGQYRKNKGELLPALSPLPQPDTSVLEKYWELAYEPLSEPDNPEKILLSVCPISASKSGLPRKNSCIKFIQIENAAMLLQSSIQHMLRKAKEEIGVEYVHFHGLLDDSIPIYYINPQNDKPSLVFQHLDSIFDFILSIGLKPVIEFSYMPRKLAKELHMPGLFDNAIISMPKCMEDWNFLITGITNHLIQRYGTKQAESWLYCCWQIPDLSESHLSLGNDENYYSLYHNTWKAVKSINSKLKFGIPNMTGARMEEGLWLQNFLNFCRENNCLPDFMGYYFYPMSKNVTKDDLDTYNPVNMSMDPDALKNNIRNVKLKVKELDLNISPFYIPMWNYCFFGNSLTDTTFRAVYTIRNVLENLDATDGYGCGLLSDFSIYARMSTNTFYGFHGLFTYNGIPKAAYYAYTLLARLGSNVLAHGEGWYVTKKDNTLQLLFYYYEHFSEQYANSVYFATNNSERYLPFALDKRLKITVPLTDLPYESYLLSETELSRASGSSFDKWLEMGAIPVETPEMADYLKAVSTPRVTNRIVKVSNGRLDISVELEPLEIRLIELRP